APACPRCSWRRWDTAGRWRWLSRARSPGCALSRSRSVTIHGSASPRSPGPCGGPAWPSSIFSGGPSATFPRTGAQRREKGKEEQRRAEAPSSADASEAPSSADSREEEGKGKRDKKNEEVRRRARGE